MLSVIIPAFHAAAYLPALAEAIRRSTHVPKEVILVDDASLDNTREIASRLGFRVVQNPSQCGPALARNRGAAMAQGDLLFFLDTDCLPQPDTFAKAIAGLNQEPGIAALIGSYDPRPEANTIVSRFRNLLHAYHHHHGKREAWTFWGACGIIRKEAFAAVGGFSSAYARPSIEDIELGLRLKQNGGRILLDPSVQVKHRKRWTLVSIIRTDVFDRAIPWTRLLQQQKSLPNDLNLGWTQRASAAATLLAPLAAWWHPLLGVGLLGLVPVLNWRFYGFLFQHWGGWGALCSFPLHLLYFTYSSVTFAAIVATDRFRLRA
ncbi:MAG: hypothetical protein OHK0021_11960 [Bryobacter sp.]